MKYLFVLFLILSFVSCKNSEQAAATPTGVTQMPTSEDQFADLKPKDGSCDSEEELKKKMEEELKKAQAQPSLQGFKDAGCDVK